MWIHKISRVVDSLLRKICFFAILVGLYLHVCGDFAWFLRGGLVATPLEPIFGNHAKV